VNLAGMNLASLRCWTSLRQGRIPACGKPYMPVMISARTLPFSDKALMLYLCLMSLGNTHVGIYMYSYCCSFSIDVMR